MSQDFSAILQGIRKICGTPAPEFIPLHAPVFQGKEKEYVLDTIDSTFVSSVGEYVTRFEQMLCEITGAKYAIACANGTSALQVALHLAGVRPQEVVITQSLSFVATANAIHHCGAEPVFLDVDTDTLGLCPKAVRRFLEEHCEIKNNTCYHKATQKRIAACVPMHSFGHPCKIEEICEICAKWHIPVVEDAAEALGSYSASRHCGTFGKFGILSFNGNKIVTTGGGGAILTNDDELGPLAKHITTTAKIPHAWKFYHDMPAWNFRMPNLNAALGCAQLEQLPHFLKIKRQRAEAYAQLFQDSNFKFVAEPNQTQSNYWLCAILAKDIQQRDAFLEASNAQDIMTRPAWELLHTLPMYNYCLQDELVVSKHFFERLINIPSGVAK